MGMWITLKRQFPTSLRHNNNDSLFHQNSMVDPKSVQGNRPYLLSTALNDLNIFPPRRFLKQLDDIALVLRPEAMGWDPGSTPLVNEAVDVWVHIRAPSHMSKDGYFRYCNHEGRLALIVGYVDVGAPVDKQLDNIAVALVCRKHEGRLALPVGCVDVGAPVDKQLDDIAVSIDCCNREGRPVIVVGRVDFGAAVDKQLGDIAISLAYRKHEGRPASAVGRADVGAAVDKQLGDIAVSIDCRNHEGRQARVVGRAYVGATAEKLG